MPLALAEIGDTCPPFPLSSSSTFPRGGEIVPFDTQPIIVMPWRYCDGEQDFFLRDESTGDATRLETRRYLADQILFTDTPMVPEADYAFEEAGERRSFSTSAESAPPPGPSPAFDVLSMQWTDTLLLIRVEVPSSTMTQVELDGVALGLMLPDQNTPRVFEFYHPDPPPEEMCIRVRARNAAGVLGEPGDEQCVPVEQPYQPTPAPTADPTPTPTADPTAPPTSEPEPVDPGGCQMATGSSPALWYLLSVFFLLRRRF